MSISSLSGVNQFNYLAPQEKQLLLSGEQNQAIFTTNPMGQGDTFLKSTETTLSQDNINPYSQQGFNEPGFWSFNSDDVSSTVEYLITSNLSEEDGKQVREIVSIVENKIADAVKTGEQEDVSEASLSAVEFLYDTVDTSDLLSNSFIAKPFEKLIGKLIEYYKLEDVEAGTFWERTKNTTESLVERVLLLSNHLMEVLSGTQEYSVAKEDILALISSWEELISEPELKPFYKDFVNESIVAGCIEYNTKTEGELPNELVGILASFLGPFGAEILTETQLDVLYEEYENGNIIYIVSAVIRLINNNPKLVENQDENFAKAIETYLNSVDIACPNFLISNLGEDLSSILSSKYTLNLINNLDNLINGGNKYKYGYRMFSNYGGLVRENPQLALDISAAAYVGVSHFVDDKNKGKPCSRGFYWGYDLLDEASGLLAAGITFVASEGAAFVNYADEVSASAHKVVTGKKDLFDVYNDEYNSVKNRTKSFVKKNLGNNFFGNGVAEVAGTVEGAVQATVTTTLTAGTACVERVSNGIEYAYEEVSGWVSNWWPF